MNSLRAHFERNAAKFSERHRLIGRHTLESLWQELSAEDLEFVQSGVASGRWLLGGKLLHSDRDPTREAGRMAESLAGAQAVIAVSLGVGFLFGALPPSIREVLVIEPNASIAVALIMSGHFEKFRGKISLFVDTLRRQDALEEILPWLQGKNLKYTLIYCHPPFAAIDKAQARRAVERIEALFEKRRVNQATIVKFQQLWNKNIFLNQRALSGARKMRDIWELAPPESVVLAGAGPSLAQSVGELKTLRKKYVLFAADTAFFPLVKNGIMPDFVFAADPQWLNHYFCQSAAAGRTAWVMDPVVVPAIPRYVVAKGATVYFWNNVFLADTYLRRGDRGDVQHGGSVSTNAFDIACAWLGRRHDDRSEPAQRQGRLILVGQDLSFSNGQAHTPGAVLEAQVFARSNRLSTMERHNLRQMTAMPALHVPGIRRKSVPTNGKLKIFLDWFSAEGVQTNKKKLRLINATHDGAKIQGFEHMSLTEALEGVGECGFKPDLPEERHTQADAGRLLKLGADFREIRKLMEESARLSQDGAPSVATLDRLNRNDARLKSLMPAKDIVGLNAQALILRITEHGEAASPAEFYAAMARAARELAHWLSKVLAV